MKKLALIISAFLFTVLSAQAQSGFGVRLGMNFNSMSDIKMNDISGSVNKKTGFHAGVLYKLDLPAGFAIQPELLYIQKGGSVDAQSSASSNVFSKGGEFKMHYLQLPVNIQWGIDLVLFRPFIMVSPFLGYQISKESNIQGLKWDSEKLGYGVGLGAGLDVWRFQLSGKYNWDLGKAAEFEWNGTDTFRGGKNRGFELSIAFIF